MPASRIHIQDVTPQVDCGRWPAKACVGDRVPIGATVVRDGHEVLRACVRYRPSGERGWREAPLEAVGNDHFEGWLEPDGLGRWEYRVQAWLDPYAGWLDEYDRKLAAGQTDLAGELSEGEALFGRGSVENWRAAALVLAAKKRREQTQSARLELDVERAGARFGAWYELFPRSWGGFRGVAKAIPQLAELGFDVVYLPPVHPIGRTNRKGRNNVERSKPGDPGSPWAIGAAEGGHDAIHPELGTLADFEALVETGQEHGVEIALDFAIQMSPDHPWLNEHPEWFQHRPDGSLKYAENPPKRYQDIHNVDWDNEHREALWHALRDVLLAWCARGVRAYRVDNPHTKPVPFWEWVIAEVRRDYPETIFLSEAFTRPAMMTLLAKAGFSQSYTYFTWKNTKAELVEWFEQGRSWSAFYRPNAFANTPDILHEYLQTGGRPAFEARLVLAATLSPSYGIYSGFEACENRPVRPGSEEYLDSEKYELKTRRLAGPLIPLITRLNALRRAHPALQRFENLAWLETHSEHLVGYLKRWEDDAVAVVVNVDPFAEREGLAILPDWLGLPAELAAVDELTGERFRWRTGRNYVKLPPGGAHVMSIESAAAKRGQTPAGVVPGEVRR
jgi:starch synthase (maltosyl-transferring)